MVPKVRVEVVRKDSECTRITSEDQDPRRKAIAKPRIAGLDGNPRLLACHRIECTTAEREASKSLEFCRMHVTALFELESLRLQQNAGPDAAMTRLTVAKTLIAAGELVYADCVSRPLRQGILTDEEQPLADEIFDILDRELTAKARTLSRRTYRIPALVLACDWRS